MMEALFATLLFIGFDWLAAGRVAAYYSDFEYRFWPLSKHRAISVVLMAIVVFATVYRGLGTPLWEIIPFGAALSFWIGAILADVTKQRREYVSPPPSDRYGS